MNANHADRNLLFGILALQVSFITRDALLKAMNAWVLEKHRPLGELLVEQGALRQDLRDMLEAMVQKHLEVHGGDAQRSLAAVGSADSVRRELGRIADSEVQASVGHVGAAADDGSWGGTVGAAHSDPADRTEHGVGPGGSWGGTVGAPFSDGTRGIRYKRLRPHARGGLGEVFVALDVELGREVALKEIQDQFADRGDSRARFLLEAEITGNLEHPGIVPIYGLGTYPDGRPYYAMRFIKGDSLQDAIERFHQGAPSLGSGARSVELRQLLGRFLDVCNAVAYAHSRGVLHRDLKPANVMLGKYGETLVVDWGLAKIAQGAEPSTGGEESPLEVTSGSKAMPTRAGQALGTPQYMSPEQAAGRLDQLGPASDVYSLGATLYCLLTGQPPFAGQVDLDALLRQVEQGDFPPPRQVRPAVSRALEAVCLKAMARRPEDRYPSPEALAGDIQRWLADQPVGAYPEPWTKRLARWARRRPALVTGAAALVFTALAAVAVAAVLIGQEQTKTLGEQQAKLEQQRKAREAQVAGLLDVAPQAVPAVLDGLAPYRDEVGPLLRQAAERPEPPGATPEALALWRQHRGRAALALLPDDPEQVKPLSARLLEENLAPDEMLLVRDALKPHGEALKADLWRQAEAGTGDAPFRALVALAAFDPASPRWEKAGAGAAGQMLRANPLYLGRWVEALRPVRDRLLPQLARVFRGEVEGLAEYRKAAANVLADYLSDRPDALAERLMEADAEQFGTLFEAARRHREKLVEVLTNEARRPAPEKATEAEREALALRQANAGLALLKLGQDGPVWPLLKHTPYPEARSRLIAMMAPGGVAAAVLVGRLEAEKDVSTRRALILALGQLTAEQVPEALRRRVGDRLVGWYRDDPDGGIHGAIDWLLRHADEGPQKRKLDWGRRKDLERIDGELAARSRRQVLAGAAGQLGLAARGGLPLAGAVLARAAPVKEWHVNGQGQTFAVIDGREPFLMGSPEGEAGRRDNETQHWRKVGRRYGVQTRPVTVHEWGRFQKAVAQVPRFHIKEYAPEAGCPVVGVSWYDAAAYCRWLSEQEGVPEYEMVYPPVKQILEAQSSGKALRLPAGHMARRGYRLPSEAEWELACRAGARTSRYYGSSLDLLPRHAWFQANSKERTWPVGQKRPNDLGLFDLHGNVWAWCHEAYDDSPSGARERPAGDVGAITNITELTSRVLRGGSFFLHAPLVRSSIRNGNRPSLRDVSSGLRVSRTYH